MKLLIASDIHGSRYYLEQLIEKFKMEKADKLVLLGDIYYHGPRNPLPKGYDPMGVSEILNSMKDKLIVVKGNCDSEVDQMISEFQFMEMAHVCVDGKLITFTHGHVFNKDNMWQGDCDVLAYGHFHINFMEKINDTLVINPGSLSLPKEQTKPGYITIENNVVEQHLLEDGSVIDKAII